MFNERKCPGFSIEEKLSQLPGDNEANGIIIGGKHFLTRDFVWILKSDVEKISSSIIFNFLEEKKIVILCRQ